MMETRIPGRRRSLLGMREVRTIIELHASDSSRWPFSLARPEAVDYSDARFPGSLDALAHVLVLPWNERYTMEHVDFLAGQIRSAAEELAGARV